MSHYPAALTRLPEWFRQEIPGDLSDGRLELISGLNLHTVCQEAHCPNLEQCFRRQELTFLILGDVCTRSCAFCAIKKNKGQSLALDIDEPLRVAQAVERLKLKYVVITSVTRDDLPDSGAGIFAKTITAIRGLDLRSKIEVLIPDLGGSPLSLKTIVNASPDVLAHNLETVPRLYPALRPQANYKHSLRLLSTAKDLSSALRTKSSLMLGLGEKEAEIISVMEDLRRHHCDCLTLGQYLAPSGGHFPVREFIPPEAFRRYRLIAEGLGFKAVSSGPLVRSSYKAEQLYAAI